MQREGQEHRPGALAGSGTAQNAVVWNGAGKAGAWADCGGGGVLEEGAGRTGGFTQGLNLILLFRKSVWFCFGDRMGERPFRRRKSRTGFERLVRG